jgi:anti-anti-sigma factor
MGLDIAIRDSGAVTIMHLRGRSTISGGESELLSDHLQELVAKGVRKLLLNIGDLSQVDSSGVSIIIETYVSLKARRRPKTAMPGRPRAAGADCISPARHYPKL